MLYLIQQCGWWQGENGLYPLYLAILHTCILYNQIASTAELRFISYITLSLVSCITLIIKDHETKSWVCECTGLVWFNLSRYVYSEITSQVTRSLVFCLEEKETFSLFKIFFPIEKKKGGREKISMREWISSYDFETKYFKLFVEFFLPNFIKILQF